MLSNREFARWITHTSVSVETQSIISYIRSNGPEHNSQLGSVRCQYPSAKMGKAMRFQSHLLDLPAMVELEYDDDVLEYYEQVPCIHANSLPALNLSSVVRLAPDYFVLRKDCAGWVECRTDEELERLSKQQHKPYCRSRKGWNSPTGCQYAEELGLYYKVRSSGETNWHFQRNIRVLDYYRMASQKASFFHRELVLAHLSAHPVSSLGDLIQSAKGILNLDDICCLIANGDIFVDLQAPLFDDMANVAVWQHKPN